MTKKKTKESFAIPDHLIYSIQKKQCVLVIGSGFSTALGYPSLDELAGILSKELGEEKPIGNILDVSEYYEYELGRPKLIDRLKEIYRTKETVLNSKINNIFTDFPWKAIISTTYDNILEEFLTKHNIEFNKIIANDPIPQISQDKINIVKLLGDLDKKESLVVTRLDYSDFMNKNQSAINYLKSLIINSHYFFIGHSLSDPDFNLIFREIYQDLMNYERKSFAVCSVIGKFEQKQWESRRINTIDIEEWEMLPDFLGQMDKEYKMGPKAAPYESFEAIEKRWRLRVIEKERFLDPQGIFQFDRTITKREIPIEDIYVAPRFETYMQMESNIFGKFEKQNRPYEQLSLFENIAEESIDNEPTKIGKVGIIRQLLNMKSVVYEMDLSLEDFIRKYKQSIIIGEPGSGKSMLLQNIAFLCSTNNIIFDKKYIPLKIPLREYAVSMGREKRRKSFYHFLRNITRSNIENTENINLFLKKHLKEGRIFLLLDGVDEVATEEMREFISAEVQKFLEIYSDCPVIITSRPSGYKSYFADFPHFKMKQFTDDEIVEYLHKWFKVSSPWYNQNEDDAKANTESLFASLSEHESVLRLARVPLLLFIIAQIHRKMIKLPKQRVKFYEYAAMTVGKTWLEGKGFHAGIDFPEERILFEGLELVAFKLHLACKNNLIDAPTLKDWLSDVFASRQGYSKEQGNIEATKFMATVRDMTGILVEKETGKYGFVHLTFQEYFAARHLAWGKGTKYAVKFIKKYLHSPRWKEVFMLMVDMANPSQADEFVEAILNNNSSYDDFLKRDILFAAECLKDEPAVSPGLRKQIANNLISTAQNDLATSIVTKIATLLKFTIHTEQLDNEFRYKLDKLTNNNDPLIRTIFLSFILNQYTEENIHSRLINFLKSDDWVQRILALQYVQFHRCFNKDIAELFINGLEDTLSIIVKESIDCCKDFEIRNREVENRIRILLHHDDKSVRKSAINYFISIKCEEQIIIDTIFNLLSDNEFSVSFEAIRYFSCLFPNNKSIIMQMIKRLHNSDWKTRDSIIQYFTEISAKNNEVYKIMLNSLKNSNKDLVIGGIEFFRGIEDSKNEIVNSIFDLLKSNNTDIKREAISFFNNLSYHDNYLINKLHSVILSSINDTDFHIRYSAINFLLNHNDYFRYPDSKIIQLLSDDHPFVKSSAIRYFLRKRYKNNEVIQKIKELLLGEYQSSRRLAIDYMEAINYSASDVRKIILNILLSDEHTVRREACNYFLKVGLKNDEEIFAVLDFFKESVQPTGLGLTGSLFLEVAKAINNPSLIYERYKQIISTISEEMKYVVTDNYYRILLHAVELQEGERCFSDNDLSLFDVFEIKKNKENIIKGMKEHGGNNWVDTDWIKFNIDRLKVENKEAQEIINNINKFQSFKKHESTLFLLKLIDKILQVVETEHIELIRSILLEVSIGSFESFTFRKDEETKDMDTKDALIEALNSLFFKISEEEADKFFIKILRKVKGQKDPNRFNFGLKIIMRLYSPLSLRSKELLNDYLMKAMKRKKIEPRVKEMAEDILQRYERGKTYIG